MLDLAQMTEVRRNLVLEMDRVKLALESNDLDSSERMALNTQLGQIVSEFVAVQDQLIENMKDIIRNVS